MLVVDAMMQVLLELLSLLLAAFLTLGLVSFIHPFILFISVLLNMQYLQMF